MEQEKFLQFELGELHAVAILEDRSILAWGPRYERDLSSGQLGDGILSSNRWPPPPAEELYDIVTVAAGRIHAFALREDGKVIVWGPDGRVDLDNSGKLPPIREIFPDGAFLSLLTESDEVLRMFFIANDKSLKYPGVNSFGLATAISARHFRGAAGWQFFHPDINSPIPEVPEIAGKQISGNALLKDEEYSQFVFWIDPVKLAN